MHYCSLSFFFFNDTATTEIYTLSLHDALPIFAKQFSYEAVKHQRFVGTGYFDAVATVISAGQTSTCALEGSTEAEQFESRSRRSEEHTSELQSPCNLVCRLLLEKKNT